MDRLYIKHAKMEIGYKDNQGFENWCQKAGLPVLRDRTERLYVIKEMFELVKDTDTKNDLENALPKADPRKLTAVMKVVSQYLQILEERKMGKADSYVAKGKVEQEYLSLFSKRINQNKIGQ